jgi:hypothetical protein
MSGYEDGSSSTHTLDRLRAIRANRRAWQNPSMKHIKRISIPSQDWLESRSHKDVISGRVPDDHSRLDIVYLSSSTPDNERYQELHFDVKFDALYIDPGQDLIVLASLALTPDAA